MPSIPRRATSEASHDTKDPRQRHNDLSSYVEANPSTAAEGGQSDDIDDTASTETTSPLDAHSSSSNINTLDLRDTTQDDLIPNYDIAPSSFTYSAVSETLPDLSPRLDSPLQKRQTQTVAIPLTYKNLNSGPAPGTVVGIVLGSVAGAIVLMLLLRFAITTSQNASRVIEADTGTEVEVIERHHRTHSSPSRQRKRRRRHHSSHHSEMSERTAPPPPMPEPAPPPPERRERILVSETRRTERSRARQPSVPPPVTVSESREHESVFEETRERRVEGDDVVEVMEEHSELSSEQPKRRSKRSSGFRTVDPNAYAGGDFPQRSVYDDGRRRSSGRR